MSRSLLIALLLAVAVVPAAAQEAGALTLGTVYRTLAVGSPRVSAARALARAADARRLPAGRLPDPQVQFGLMNRMLPGFGIDQTLGMNTVQLMQMVPLAGKLGLSGRTASALAGAEDERAQATWWEQRALAAMAFYDLNAAEGELAIARETLRLLRDIAATARSMYVAGQGRQTDVLRAQVEIARMEEDTLRISAMREAAAARLNGVLGRPVEAPVPPTILVSLPGEIPSRDSLGRLAATGRSMVLAGEGTMRAAEAQERLAAREWWPDLQLGVQYGQRSMAGGTNRMVSLMVGFTLPIYGRQSAMRREAEAMRDMATADLAAVRAETAGRLGELYADWMRAHRLSHLYGSTILPQAEANVASALSAYRNGGVDFMTLLDAQMSVNQYRQELVRLQSEQGTALAGLEELIAMELFNADLTALAIAKP